MSTAVRLAGRHDPDAFAIFQIERAVGYHARIWRHTADQCDGIGGNECDLDVAFGGNIVLQHEHSGAFAITLHQTRHWNIGERAGIAGGW